MKTLSHPEITLEEIELLVLNGHRRVSSLLFWFASEVLIVCCLGEAEKLIIVEGFFLRLLKTNCYRSSPEQISLQQNTKLHSTFEESATISLHKRAIEKNENSLKKMAEDFIAVAIPKTFAM